MILKHVVKAHVKMSVRQVLFSVSGLDVMSRQEISVPLYQNNMESVINIDSLVADREAFNAFVYTPLEQAIDSLKEREANEELREKVKSILPNGIPEILEGKKSAILFRHLATPNYEIRRFVSIIDVIDHLDPVFWEYHSDKFTSNNECKHALGKMSFHFGRGKKGGQIINRVNVIDFNTYNGKKISDVKTVWGESLIDFHHNLFTNTYPKIDHSAFFDASEWFSKSGGNAKEYYKYFLTLFLQNGILFENFMLDEKEMSFTKEVFLTAFIEVYKQTGFKPLIVALSPTDIEGDHFWMCHPGESEEHIKNKIV